MARNSKLLAVTLASLLVLTTFAPGALAATAANAAANTSVDVSTEAATDLSAEGATLNGNVTELNGSENATVAFQYWEANDSENATTVEVGELPGEGTFGATIDGLSPNTTYVYVATAEAERGNETANATGDSVEFTTADATQPLGVETANATDVTNASATLEGELTGLNGSDNASVSFEYWTAGDEANATTTTAVDRNSTGTFSAAVENLSGNTTYVYVAQAEASNDTVTGEQVEFTTQPDVLPLGVETTNATDVTNDSATLGGDLTGLNGSDSANVSFDYWVGGNKSNTTTTVAAGTLSDASTFSAGVSGLQNNTTYVYVAQAEAGNDTVTGEEKTFTPGLVEQEEEGFVPPNGPFGQQVVAFIDYLRNSDDNEERNLGQSISSWVTANNPGADNRPDHAGPPEDKGPNSDKERGPPENKERGPPEDKGPNAKDDDKRRGPPEDKGPNKDDGDDGDVTTDTDDGDDGDDVEDDSDEEEEEDDDDEDDDKGGPPEGKGYNK